MSILPLSSSTFLIEDPRSLFFMRGFAPERRGPFVSAKGAKTIRARAWPQGVPLPQSRLLGLRNSLRSDSPRPQRDFGTGAQPRPQAPRHGLCMFSHRRSPITNVEDRLGEPIWRNGLQCGDAVVLYNPFNLNTTAHERMDLAVIGIGARRQAPHAEPLAGMKMFGGKGTVPATPASVVCHSMRLHRPVIPLHRLPRKDCHGRGRVKGLPVQKDDLRIPRLAQTRRKHDEQHDPAEKGIYRFQRRECPFPGTTQRSSPTGLWFNLVGAGLCACPSRFMVVATAPSIAGTSFVNE